MQPKSRLQAQVLLVGGGATTAGASTFAPAAPTPIEPHLGHIARWGGRICRSWVWIWSLEGVWGGDGAVEEGMTVGKRRVSSPQPPHQAVLIATARVGSRDTEKSWLGPKYGI
jgi:hypothetical protein